MRDLFEEDASQDYSEFDDTLELLNEYEEEHPDAYSEFDAEGEFFEPEADEGLLGEVNRRSRAYIRWVQQSLNQLIGAGLKVDGIPGSRTRSAIRSFQRKKGLAPDGKVGRKTERALVAAGASPPPALSSRQKFLRGPRPPTIAVAAVRLEPQADILSEVSAGVAIAGLGFNVYNAIAQNKGDITWHLQQMKGAKHPFDKKDRYKNIAPWHRKATKVRQLVDNLLGDEISADFEVRFWYNGHSVGYISIENTRTNDAWAWGLDVTAKILPDPNAYRIGQKKPIAAVEVAFNYRFSRTIGSDLIYIARLKLYGDGQVGARGVWTQR